MVAKNFLFRYIYADPATAASAFSFDPKFTHVSSSRVFWQGVCDETANKYGGHAQWRSSLIQEVSKKGCLSVPTGRQYTIPRKENQTLDIAKIFNYPVQGLGHDLMAIVRVSLRQRLKKAGLQSLLVSTVHDSILLDCPMQETSKVCKLIFNVFDDIPMNFEKIFKVPLDLPLRVEVKIGPDWGTMEEITKEMLE